MRDVLKTCTPGEWEAAPRNAYSDLDGQSRIILGDNGDVRIAIVYCRDEEGEANADLFAASRAMYEALEDIVKQAEKTVVPIGADLADSIRVFGKQALAQAQGKKQRRRRS